MGYPSASGSAAQQHRRNLMTSKPLLHLILGGFALTSFAVHAEDVVRLGNLKFAHYGAVSYMKEVCPKYGIKLEERMFPKGPDIMPAIVAGEIDLAALA